MVKERGGLGGGFVGAVDAFGLVLFLAVLDGASTSGVQTESRLICSSSHSARGDVGLTAANLACLSSTIAFEAVVDMMGRPLLFRWRGDRMWLMWSM